MLARWRTKTSAASASPSQAAPARTEEREPDRRGGRGDQRRERGDAEGDGGGEPGGAGGEARRPGERQRQAEEGRDPLAAAEAEPDREEVAEEGGEARDHRRRLAGERPGDAAPPPRPCRRRAAASRRPRALLPVRSTLVAPMLPEPMRAQVAEAERAGDQHAERDRAEQVAEQGGEREASCGLPREDLAPADPGAQHPALHPAQVVGGVLRLRAQRGAVEHEGRVGVEEHEVGRARPARAGRRRGRAAAPG